MNKESLHEIAATQQVEESSLHITPIEGGFTGATKYVIEGVAANATPLSLFSKVVDVATSSVEVAVLDTEARMYGVLTDLQLTGKYFPNYRGYVKTPTERALLIDYLPDVSWGGPWDRDNIEKLSASIAVVHDTPLTNTAIVNIRQIGGELKETLQKESASNFNDVEKDRLFHEAWKTQENSFVNSRGIQYFSAASNGSIDTLLETEATYDKDSPSKLILKDLNFGNLAVASDRVYFVDPVYLDIGNPTHDLVVLGVNILRGLSDDPEGNQLREVVKSTFLKDRAALAHLIKYWVACTSLAPTDSQNAWMDFQQSCAATALTVWEELAA